MYEMTTSPAPVVGDERLADLARGDGYAGTAEGIWICRELQRARERIKELERKVAAADAYIQMLERGAYQWCSDLSHHGKGEFHDYGTPCPVQKKLLKAQGAYRSAV